MPQKEREDSGEGGEAALFSQLCSSGSNLS